jgi:hypothetical protein
VQLHPPAMCLFGSSVWTNPPPPCIGPVLHLNLMAVPLKASLGVAHHIAQVIPGAAGDPGPPSSPKLYTAPGVLPLESNKGGAFYTGNVAVPTSAVFDQDVAAAGGDQGPADAAVGAAMVAVMEMLLGTIQVRGTYRCHAIFSGGCCQGMQHAGVQERDISASIPCLCSMRPAEQVWTHSAAACTDICNSG